ncbi:tetratricopeptide repeat protein [Streptomyces sp. WG-D5]
MENMKRSARRPLAASLVAVLAGCALATGVWALLPGEERAAAPDPAGRAALAAAAGAPAALPDLAALIRERRAAVRADPRDDRSWAALGAAYVERGTRSADTAYYVKAERALGSSLKARPKRNAAALDGLTALAVARGDWPAARKWGEAAVRLAPDSGGARSRLVDAYQGLGDHKAAGRALDRLAGLAPDTGKAAGGTGDRRSGLASGTAVALRTADVYWDRGWREDAAATLSDAAARAEAPAERAELLRRGGELAWARGEAADALRHFDAALAADPHCHAALAGRGRALASLGRTTEAVRAYRSALAKRPAPEYALELGELYASLDRPDEARAQYDVLRERVAAQDAHGVDDALVLGRFEADHGDPAAAVERLRAQWRRAPSPATADALGWALHRAGSPREALPYVRRSTDRQKSGSVREASYMFHRAAVEAELGDTAAARRHYDESLRINPTFSPLAASEAQQALTRLDTF